MDGASPKGHYGSCGSWSADLRQLSAFEENDGSGAEPPGSSKFGSGSQEVWAGERLDAEEPTLNNIKRKICLAWIQRSIAGSWPDLFHCGGVSIVPLEELRLQHSSTVRLVPASFLSELLVH